MRYRSTLLIPLLLLLGVFAAACSSSPSGSSATATTKPVTTTTAQVIVATTVTIDGKTVKVPTEDGTDPIKSFGDTGQQVILTSTGVLPLSLYASQDKP